MNTPFMQAQQNAWEQQVSAKTEAEHVRHARHQAFAQATAMGLPNVSEESWKYSPLRVFGQQAFTPQTTVLLDSELSAEILHELAAIPNPRLVFINGILSDALSDMSDLASQVDIRPLATVLQTDNIFSQQFLHTELTTHTLHHLNQALAQQGIAIHVQNSARCGLLHLVHIVTKPQQMQYFRQIVVLEKNTQLAVAEYFLGEQSIDAHAACLNHHTTLQVQDHAQLSWHRLLHQQAKHWLFAPVEVAVQNHAQIQATIMVHGTAFARQEWRVVLQAPHAKVQINGCHFLTDHQHADTQIHVTHATTDGESQINWRSVADQQARSILVGQLDVSANADRSKAHLNTKNLLLADTAEIDTKPVLHIDADEVEASHSATVGQLRAEELFYLRARGIPLQDAQHILMRAFCESMLTLIEDVNLRTYFASRMFESLE